MNLQLSDVVANDYQVISIVLSICAGIALCFFVKKLRSGDSEFAPGMSFVFISALALMTFGMGSSEVATAKPYYDRLSNMYATFGSEADFWIQEDIKELADYGTINGQGFDKAAINNSNKAVALLAKHFPSDDANVKDPNTLRSVRDSIKSCLTAPQYSEYVRRLSEVPVKLSELDAIKKEVNIIADGRCNIPP